MKADTTLLLDVGGQGCRALAVDGHAQVRFETRRKVNSREDGTRVEQDAEELAGAVDSVTSEALLTMEQQSLPIARAALAVQRGSIVCWDRLEGTALTPVISWRDRRALAEMEPLAAHAGEIRRRTGLRFSPYGGASKIAWCLQKLANVKGAFERGRLVCGPLGSFLLQRLLAEQPNRVDDTLAQRTLLWSRQSFGWDSWLLEQFGLCSSMLPEVVQSNVVHGHLRGARRPTPLNLLMGDQNCVPYLDGTPDPGTLYINLGTGAFLLRPLREPVDDDRFQLTLLGRNHDCRWALEGSVHGAASAIAWLEREQSCAFEHERMEGLRERVTEPPLFINTIDGLGSPWWCRAPTPGFVGEHDQHDGDARLLAVLESIAFLVKACVDAMNERVEAPTRLVLSGGLSRSDTVCSLLADLLDINALRLVSGEGTALGLWCRLHDRALPDRYFETVPSQRNQPLARRFDRWLGHIEAIAGGA